MTGTYMNPYYYQQQQYNVMAPYQDRLAQLQAQYGQQQPFNQMPQQPQMMGLNGEIVDSVDVVKAKNVDMSGAVTYYPKADLSEIYTKQLTPDGTSRIITYRAVQENAPRQPEQPTVSVDMMNAMLGQLKQDLSAEIGGIKELVGALTVQARTADSPRSQRGGRQNDAV